MRDGIACRPCFDRCIFHEPFCITTITVAQVLSAVERQLTDLGRGRPVGELHLTA
jgi:hypothetical protein